MVLSTNLGFPRVGLNRELKRALESYWKGDLAQAELLSVAKDLRARHWRLQAAAGIQHIPSNDFAFYDHVLGTIAMLGAVPERYQWTGNSVDLDLYFAMARGRQDGATDVVAMEMTKWFDTNYHYMVPEFKKTTTFKWACDKIVSDYKEAKALGIETRPVLLGPVSFLLLGKAYDEVSPISLLDKVLPVYEQVLAALKEAGAQWIQVDEPILVLDLPKNTAAAYATAFQRLAESGLKILLTTYFGALGSNLDIASSLPVQGLHVDLHRAPAQLNDVLAKWPKDRVLSLGLVDGRNIWKTNLKKAAETLATVVKARGSENVFVGPSCSLLHSPVDLDAETKLDDEFKGWLAFATQKVAEIALLANAQNEGIASYQAQFDANAAAIATRASSSRIHNPAVKNRVSALTAADAKRDSVFSTRIKAQQALLKLPLLPTTTIGSFPQTTEIRQARAAFKKGEMSEAQYDQFLETKTRELMLWQDEIGIDVPVHGEYERNDMVEYFGEQLSGYAFTQNGWVQSYGSRCVKPPVIFGDVSRPAPMTLRWTAFAQTVTQKPVKGMLTGPVTMLQWAFVRDDQPRSETCKQIALAIRDEVKDLEKANIRIIQIDEPAIREGLPLRRVDWSNYLEWAVESFRISSSGIDDATQIHTHMCYSEFNDIIDSIAAMDADVISIETSRSAMELLDAFVEFKYPNEIGPGVYDIHSPRVPNVSEMETLLNKALEVLDPKQVWVNPDCGLKTRGWPEVRTALINMVAVAKKTSVRLGVQTAA